MKKILFILLLLLNTVFAAQAELVLPKGTILSLQFDESVVIKDGSLFYATLNKPVALEGEVVLEDGSLVEGLVEKYYVEDEISVEVRPKFNIKIQNIINLDNDIYEMNFELGSNDLLEPEDLVNDIQAGEVIDYRLKRSVKLNLLESDEDFGAGDE